MSADHAQELLAEHKALAEAAHERGDIPEANYQYGWIDALTAIEQVQPDTFTMAEVRISLTAFAMWLNGFAGGLGLGVGESEVDLVDRFIQETT